MIPTSLKICVIAGEVSGDSLAASLMQDLKAKQADISFIGVGGDAMAKEGLVSIFPMRDLSVMGIMEIVPRLPLIMKRIKQTIDLIIKEKPDLVITVDSPDFSFRVAKGVQDSAKIKPKMVHYVAPTVWAWRPERASKVASLYDGVLCLFPMEPAYFENAGMKACFVGHPAVSKFELQKNNIDIKVQMKLPPHSKIIGFLPGSRIAELTRTGSVLRQVLNESVEGERGVNILAYTLPHLRREVRYLLQGFRARVHIFDEPEQKWPCFAAMDVAVATSGTVGLELGIAGVPHLIGYKMNPLTAKIVASKVTSKYAHLVNILLDKPVVPEFIQKDCRPIPMARCLQDILVDDRGQKEAFSEVRNMLACNGQPALAADFIFSEIL